MNQLELDCGQVALDGSADFEIISKLLEIYEQKFLADYLNEIPKNNWTRETINRWVKGKASPKLSKIEHDHLLALLPKPIVTPENYDFKFIDLFAGLAESVKVLKNKVAFAYLLANGISLLHELTKPTSLAMNPFTHSMKIFVM